MRRVWVNCVAAALCAAAMGTAAMGHDTGQAVSSETLRLAALRAIFPGMQISFDRSKRIDDSWPEKPKPGALNEAEREASEEIITEKFSSTRQLRFRLFRRPKENGTGRLAVLQYRFPGANPTMLCPSIGLPVHLVGSGANWAVKDRYLLETFRHYSLQGIRLLDLTGDGADELVMESNIGGAGTAGSALHVFDLRQGRLDEVPKTESRMQYVTTTGYTGPGSQ